MEKNKHLVIGAGGGDSKGDSGGSARTPVEDPDNLRSTQYARVIDLLGEGQWEEVLVGGLKGLYFNGTPVQNADGTNNFKDLTYNIRTGTQAQTHMPGNPTVESEVPVSVEVTNATSVTRQLTDSNLDYCRVTISTPRLTLQDTTTGDLKGTKVDYAIDIQSNGGGFVEVQSRSFWGKTTTRYRRSHDILLSGSPPWDIRVRRVTADNGSSTLSNDIWWDSYTKVIDHKFSYPNSVLVSTQVSAAQFDNIPTRAFDCKMLRVLVPSNYDPTTRVYTGVWDGTFTTAWSDNPAWAFYDLVTESRYGLGSFIDSSLVDKWELYEIGQYCDELVEDGFGNMEPRFTINIYLQNREEAYTVLKDLASVFRGMIYWSANGIIPIQDKPEDTFTQFTNANVINGTFNYQGSASKTRHTVALVGWNDPDDQYKQKIEYVEDQTAVGSFGFNETEIAAVGCTSRGQAHRVGKWLLFSENSETEAVTFQIGYSMVSDTQLAPGKIIKTLDQHRAGTRLGGRIISSTTSSVTIDSAVTLSSGVVYTVTITLPDGTLEDHVLTNSTGSHTVLTIGGTFTTQPVDYSIWIVSSDELSPEFWRVISVSEDEPHLFSVNAIEHNSSKYAFVEQDIVLETRESTLFSTLIDPVYDITTEESLYEISPGVLGTKIHLGWSAPVEAVNFRVLYRKDNENFQEIETRNNQLEILDAGFGDYEFKITAYGALGASSFEVSYFVTILGLTAPPSDITDFNINILGSTAYLSWSPVADLDLSYYQIKHAISTTGVTWGSAVDLVSQVSKPATSITVPAMVGTYLIKAFDASGNESINATSITSTIAAIEGLNAIATLTEQTTFLGNKTTCGVISNELRLDSVDTMDDWPTLDSVLNLYYGVNGTATTGTYLFDNDLDLGAIYTSRVTADVRAYGYSLSTAMSSWTTLSALPTMDNGDNSLWDTTLQIRTTDDDPVGSPTWSAWKSFIVGDYTARAFEFRLLLNTYDTNVTPSVTVLSVQIDMPDRTYGENDLVCTVAGLGVVYSPAFKADPAVGISAQGLQTGDYYAITSKSSTGFTIQFFDSGDTAIQRTFDYVAKGYGQVN